MYTLSNEKAKNKDQLPVSSMQELITYMGK